MKRLIRIATLALPLLALAAAPAYAEAKTRDKTTVKFEGMLGRMFNLFGGKAAKEGVEGMTAVKGNRKATISDTTGHIIDLAEEKVYDLDMRKKTYTVTTFEELRRRMRESEEKAKEQAQKEEPGKPAEQQKPTKEYQVDFDVKDTGQKKSIAGYDTHETIVTITVHEKGKALEDSGGIVMTNDMWLGPRIPQLKEFSDFDLRYWKQLQGPQTAEMSAEQMAAVVAMFPLVTKAMERMEKDGDKLSGTPLDTTTTVESVKSPDQLTQAQQQSNNSGASGGGIGGLLAKKMMKKEEPKARSTIFTTHHEVLEVSTSVGPADLAIPPDFKEKK
ncbi:MAG TPA: hypothetical protein VEL79_00515 [Vicinamibacterales bacterium]|nr:hypothetical protein [Vicinamibacterales bacterium]